MINWTFEGTCHLCGADTDAGYVEAGPSPAWIARTDDPWCCDRRLLICVGCVVRLAHVAAAALAGSTEVQTGLLALAMQLDSVNDDLRKAQEETNALWRRRREEADRQAALLNATGVAVRATSCATCGHARGSHLPAPCRCRECECTIFVWPDPGVDDPAARKRLLADDDLAPVLLAGGAALAYYRAQKEAGEAPPDRIRRFISADSARPGFVDAVGFDDVQAAAEALDELVADIATSREECTCSDSADCGCHGEEQDR